MLLLVELVEQAFLAHVERAARAAVGRGPLGTVVETPARGAAGYRAVQVRQKIVRGRLPATVSPAKRLLVMYRRRTLQLFVNARHSRVRAFV